MTTSVLVVEDDFSIAECIAKRLRASGYLVAAIALSGEEALRKTLELRPEILLININLGGAMNGVVAANLIRERAGIPVVYLSANSDEATLQRAKLTESFGFVLLPCEEGDLRAAIEVGLHTHRMERKLREGKQWIVGSLNSIGDGMIGVDSHGRVSGMNPQAEWLTGWSQADAVGRDVTEVFSIFKEFSREPVPNPALAAMATGKNVPPASNLIFTRKDGSERFVDAGASPIRDEQGATNDAVMVFRDITESRQLQVQLRQARRLEVLGSMASGIVHDFHNIMTLVSGFGELLRDEGLSTEERRDYVDEICGCGERAAQLTRQVFAIVSPRPLTPALLDLNALLRELVGLVRRMIGLDIEFDIELAPDIGAVRVVSTQIEQVIMNLVGNARDAMPRGGRLVIATANVELDEAAVSRWYQATPGTLCAAVRDGHRIRNERGRAATGL